MHRHRFLLVLSLVITVLAIVLLSLPRPIISDTDYVRIDYAIYNPYRQSGGEPIYITDFNGNEIIAILRKYSEKFSFSKTPYMSLDDIEIELFLSTKDGPKSVVLGDINYSSYGYGEWMYKIINPDNLLDELKRYMDTQINIVTP